VVRPRRLDGLVDALQVGGLVQVHAADASRTQGHDREHRPGRLQRRRRGIEFALFIAVRRQYRDPLAAQWASELPRSVHRVLPSTALASRVAGWGFSSVFQAIGRIFLLQLKEENYLKK